MARICKSPYREAGISAIIVNELPTIYYTSNDDNSDNLTAPFEINNTTTSTNMAPSVTIDNTSDFDMPTAPAPTKSDARTLLLAPPSIAAHPEALTKTVEAHDRSVTDIQMLDRLAMGLVALPASTYDIVLLLTDVDGSRQESSQLLDRTVMERIVAAMKEGGRLKAQDGSFARIPSAEQTEAILAGLTKGDGEGMVKPQSTNAGQTVKLSFGKKKANAAAVPLNGIEAANTAKRKEGDNAAGNGVQATPAGVGFIDNVDDFDANMDYDDDDDEPYIPSNEELQAAEKIDPDTLLTEEDRLRPIIVRKYTICGLFLVNATLTSHQPRPASLTQSADEPAKIALAVWQSV